VSDEPYGGKKPGCLFDPTLVLVLVLLVVCAVLA
jgi:hypothetical protein